MANLKTRVDKLYNMVKADIEMPSILVFAELPTDKLAKDLLEDEHKGKAFVPYMPSKLDKKLEKAETLGELEQLCRRYGYGLDILPVAQLETLEELWG